MALEELLEYEIRLMKREEIPDVLDLWRETNLSDCSYSVNTWYDYDPEGFYVAVTSDGTVLGVCAGILQHKDLAFIGMYTVKSTFRKRGIGRRIWNRVMERIGDRNTGVNPVPDQLENYRDKAGFSIQSDFCSVVYVADQISTSQMINELPNIEIHLVSSDDVEITDAVAEYDASVLGFLRSGLFPLLCNERKSVTLVARNSYDNSMCGYGNIKGNGLIGPLFADDKAIAELILYHLINNVSVAESKHVTVMTVDCNQDAMEMFKRLGFHRKFERARLYRTEEVEVQYNKVFGQHNLNFSVF